jgi:hypothetical protein
MASKTKQIDEEANNQLVEYAVVAITDRSTSYSYLPYESLVKAVGDADDGDEHRRAGARRNDVRVGVGRPAGPHGHKATPLLRGTTNQLVQLA